MYGYETFVHYCILGKSINY